MLNVTRGLFGTVAAAHAAGEGVSLAMVPGRVYVFSFPVVAPINAQAPAPTLQLAAHGAPTPPSAVTDTTAPLPWAGATAGGALPLAVVAPAFAVRRIGQRTHFPGAANTLFITLSPTVDLASPPAGAGGANSSVTIAGLLGVSSATIAVADLRLPAIAGALATPAPNASAVRLPAPAPAVEGYYAGFELVVAGETRRIAAYTADRLAFLNASLAAGAPAAGAAFAVYSLASAALAPTAEWASGTITLRVSPGSALRRGAPYGLALAVTNPLAAVAAGGGGPTVSASGGAVIPAAPLYVDLDTRPVAGATTTLEDVAAGAPLSRCACAAAAACCQACARLRVAAAAGIAVGRPLRVEGEAVTVLAVEPAGATGAADVFVRRSAAPGASPAHRAGVGVELPLPGDELGVAITVLATAATAGDASLAVAEPGRMAKGQYLLVGAELMRVAASPVAGGAVSVLRGLGGTAAAAHAAGAAVVEPVGSGGSLPGDAGLRVAAPGFVVRRIGQRTPYPGAANILSLTLSPNLDLPSGAEVTVSGLSGAVATDGATPLSELDSSTGAAAFGGTGSWTGATSTLMLTVAALLKAGSLYAFAFAVANPFTAQPAPTVSVAASGGAAAVAAAAMTWDPTAAANVLGAGAGDGRALKVDAPGFPVRDLAQDSRCSGQPFCLRIPLLHSHCAGCHLFG